jgi:hypothetical protein
MIDNIKGKWWDAWSPLLAWSFDIGAWIDGGIRAGIVLGVCFVMGMI